MKRYKAVIFDLDGVLVSTDEYHYLAWQYVANVKGLKFNRELNHKLRGVSRLESLDIILNDNQCTFTEKEKQETLELKNKRYLEYLKELTPISVDRDVLFTLEQLKKYLIPLAIGSSSKNAKYILNQIGLLNHFDVIIDGNDISRSKPHPEVFLWAAHKMGLSPKDCLVVEDAKAGIKAAVDGGFSSAGIHDAAQDEKTTYAIEKLSEILDLLI